MFILYNDCHGHASHKRVSAHAASAEAEAETRSRTRTYYAVRRAKQTVILLRRRRTAASCVYKRREIKIRDGKHSVH